MSVESIDGTIASIYKHLEEKEIINGEEVTRLRMQINSQHQNATSKERAKLLAQGIHKSLDHHLPNFSLESKRRMQKTLITKAISTPTFSVTSYDVVISSLTCASNEERNAKLVEWINNDLEIDPIVVETFVEMIIQTENQTAVAVEDPLSDNQILVSNGLFYKWLIVLGLFMIFIFLFSMDLTENSPHLAEEVDASQTVDVITRPMNDLPVFLQFETINEAKLRDWLIGRDSLLAEDPYFSTILQVASDFNIHPLLLFAITGQEQGFVKKNHKNAKKMANNPFNVFHSWKDFNTTILESTQIAARTIVNLSKDRPEEIDAVQWINRKYAEDPNWWVGVTAIFNQLEIVVK